MRRVGLVLAACTLVALAVVWCRGGDEPRAPRGSEPSAQTQPGPGLEGMAQSAPAKLVEVPSTPAPATPDTSVIVAGHVRGPAGGGAEGVRIGVYLRSSGKRVGTARSASDGSFRLALPAGTYDVRVVPDARWASAQTFPIDGSTSDLALRVHGGRTLRGTVVPVRSASSTSTVVTVEWHGNRTQATTAGPQGRFRFQMPADARAVRLWVRRGERFWRVPLDADALDPHVEVLEPTWHAVRGTVQTASGAYATAGTVRLTALDTSLHLARTATLGKDSPGTFAFEGVQAGSYVLTAAGPGREHTVRRRIEVPAGPVALRFAPRRPVTVRIHGATPRMSLYAIRNARVRSIETRRTVYEDPLTLEIPMSTDVHMLYVGSNDPSEDRFAIATVDESTRSVDLEVGPGLAIAGTMKRPPGTGRTFVEVHPIGRATQVEVAKDGSFRIGGLPPGSYRLHWKVGNAQGTTNWSEPIEAGTLDVELEVFDD